MVNRPNANIHTDTTDEMYEEPTRDGEFTPTMETYRFSVKVTNKITGAAISGASVVFTVNSNGSSQPVQTDSDGRASIISTSLPIRYCTCTVTAEGYVMATDVRIYEQEAFSGYDLIQLDPQSGGIITKYIWTVTDSTDGSFVSDVKIDIYKTDDTLLATKTTSPLGIAIFSSAETRLKYDVSKNGYLSPRGLTISNDNPRAGVTIDPINKKDYYFSISVFDESNKPISDVKIRLYSDLKYANPYVIKTVTKNSPNGYNDSQLIDEICEVIKSYICDRLSIDYFSINDDTTLDDLGLTYSDIASIIYDKYGQHADGISSRSIRQTAGEVFGRISNDKPIDITICTTNDNGIATCVKEQLAFEPSSIYAHAITTPNDYEWVTYSGLVNPKLNETPSLRLSVSKKSKIVSYYNIRVLDEQTYKPIEGASIQYRYNNESIATRTTNSDGYVMFSGYYDSLVISVLRDRYSSIETLVDRALDSSYMNIYLNQLYTIRVVNEETSYGIKDIVIGIYKRDELGNSLELGKYITSEYGYIEPVNTAYYTSTQTIYAVVLGYDKSEVLLPDSRAIIFKIIPGGEEEEEKYNEFEQFNNLSVNNIQRRITTGNKELKNGGVSKKVSYNTNDFRMNIIDPDTINVYDIFACKPVMTYNSKKSVISHVDISLKQDLNTLSLKGINRYSGYYNPIFTDILFYNNFEGVKKNEETNTEEAVRCPFSNASFDYTYSDNYGKFGIIKNLWFHKVNDNKDVEIVSSLTPYYPLTGQYALDYKDYNIFSNNWDINYYTKQVDTETAEPCQNISSMKNKLCMFGSKYLNVPEKIEFFGLSLGDDNSWNGEWNDDWISNPSGCPGEIMFKEINSNSVNFYFFLKKRILRYFKDQLKTEFEKYISGSNPNLSFGMEGLDDDIEEYVNKNILKLYKLDKVRIFIRRTKKGQHDSRIENDYGRFAKEYLTNENGNYYIDAQTGKKIPLNVEYFRSHGFAEINTVTLSKENWDDFDRKLVYNLKRGEKEDFGFGFILTKI